MFIADFFKELTPVTPVLIISDIMAQECFGDDFKYDLPKECKHRGLLCFYYPNTRMYIIVIGEVIKQ